MLLKIYVQGMIFLLVALAINILAKQIGLPSWYDFLQKPNFKSLSLIWLLGGYPFLLGLTVYGLNLLFNQFVFH